LNDLLSVEVLSKLNPETWDKVGQKFTVKEYPYIATYGCQINKCFCAECVSSRGNSTLHKMYEVVNPEEKRGSMVYFNSAAK
jgi:hypothetical protein